MTGRPVSADTHEQETWFHEYGWTGSEDFEPACEAVEALGFTFVYGAATRDADWPGNPAALDALVAELAAVRQQLADRTFERESLRMERDAALHNGRKSNEYLIGRAEAAEAALRETRQALNVAAADFLRVKDAIERHESGRASSIAYDSWYRCVVAAPEPLAAAGDADDTRAAPETCANCGADESHIGYDPADGFTCSACGATDADE